MHRAGYVAPNLGDVAPQASPGGYVMDSRPGLYDSVSRRHHCLPAIVDRLWQSRERAKRDHNAPLSQAMKIIMNAFYSVLDAPGCRFFR